MKTKMQSISSLDSNTDIELIDIEDVLETESEDE